MRPRLTPPFVIAMIFFTVVFLIILAGTARPAAAVCNGTEMCVSWGRPATYSNGSPLAATKVVRYTVFGVGGDSSQFAQTTAVSVKLIGFPPGNQCVVVVAQVLGDGPTHAADDPGPQSDPGNQACKMIKLPAPTDGKIESPTDGAIENH